MIRILSRSLSTLNWNRIVIDHTRRMSNFASTITLDKSDAHQFASLCSELKQQAYVTQKYYKINESDNGNNLHIGVSLQNLITHLDDNFNESTAILYESAHKYDFKDIRANGYRSFISVTMKCCSQILAQLRKMKTDGYTHWMGTTDMDFRAHVDCLGELKRCLLYLVKFREYCHDAGLFPKLQFVNTPEFEKLIDQSDYIRQDVFYGRCIGFHYCPSARRIMKFLGCAMSGYSFSYESNKSGIGAIFNTIMKTMTSFYDQEDRGRQIAYVTRHASVEFCKTFWNFSDHPLLLHAPNMILPPIEMAYNISLPAKPFKIMNIHGQDVSVPIPQASQRNGKMENNPIKLRYLSFKKRLGTQWIDGNKKTVRLERSPHLLVHIHGGGFVAQSSQAHDVYLRQWADDLDCPIVAIDYSHAPEYPFPRALEECVYAFCWIKKNVEHLGSTGQRIVVCGDSAGGNLSITSTLKMIELGLPIPHGLMLSYTPALVAFTPSPSRLLSVMDPLLPVGILSRCLLAYAGVNEESILPGQSTSSKSDNDGSDTPVGTSTSGQLHNETQPNKSPTKPYERKSDSFWDKLTTLSQLDESSKSWLSSKFGNLTNSADSPSHLSKSASTPDFNQGFTNFSSSSSAPMASPVSGADEPKKFRFPTSTDATSPLIRVRQATIPQSPYMSPYLADDSLFQKLPPTRIVACHMDPLLDDCIELAKRLHHLKVPIEIRVLADVPHGFLNLVLMSDECRKGSELCVLQLKQLFNLDSLVSR